MYCHTFCGGEIIEGIKVTDDKVIIGEDLPEGERIEIEFLRGAPPYVIDGRLFQASRAFLQRGFNGIDLYLKQRDLADDPCRPIFLRIVADEAYECNRFSGGIRYTALKRRMHKQLFLGSVTRSDAVTEWGDGLIVMLPGDAVLVVSGEQGYVVEYGEELVCIPEEEWTPQYA